MPVTLTTPGLRLVEHELRVPLDHARPGGEQITIFAREVADLEGPDRPLLLYLQGGPGHEAARPTRNPSSPGWLDRALRDFRVLLLDQRGTGRSTPVGALPGLAPAAQAGYLTHMRTTWRAWPPTRCRSPRRSTPTTCTSSARSRSRRRPRSAACARG